MGLKHLEDVTYFRLNNEINRPVNGQIMLHKDKEALDAFFKENVVPNTMAFDSITDKINYLIEHNYIETAWKNCINLSRTKTSNSNHSWPPISFTTSTP